MLTAQITVGEAISLIHESILDFQDGLSQETINDIVYSINNQIQVRDYFLGLPETFGLEACLEFVKYLGASLENEEDIYAVATIASAYEYENENIPMVAILLSKVLDMKPDYSLALLLDRVAQANWPADSFVQMRKELHPKVVENLEEIQDQLI